MKKVAILVLSIGVLYLMFAACSGDIILKSESDLRGTFNGDYIVTLDYGSTFAKEYTQPVVWIFTDSTYIMYIDTTRTWDLNFSICRVDGRYSLTEGVNLFQLHSQPDEDAGFNACKEKTNPQGDFSLTKSNNADTLRMVQYDQAESMYKELRIIRIGDAP
jgi:hypothetical protein